MYLGLDLFQDDSETRNRDLCRAQTSLILKLGYFPEEVEIFSSSGSDDRLTRFSRELADDLSDFLRRFNLGEGFFNAQLSVLKARLGLILATRQVLGNALGIIDLPVLEQK
jgi:arginyl-tRNA synthetase